VNDANDVAALTAALDTFKATTDKPTFIVVHSIIGYGSPKAGSEKAHGEPLGEENIRLTKQAYGWPEDAKFLVPDGVAEHFKGAIAGRGAPLREAWDALRARYATEYPEESAQLDAIFTDSLPDGFPSALGQLALGRQVDAGHALDEPAGASRNGVAALRLGAAALPLSKLSQPTATRATMSRSAGRRYKRDVCMAGGLSGVQNSERHEKRRAGRRHGGIKRCT